MGRIRLLFVAGLWTGSALAGTGAWEGSYTYAEKGGSGHMKVAKVSECSVAPEKLGCMSNQLLVVELFTASRDGSTCDLKAVEIPSARVTGGSKLDALFAVETEDKQEILFFASFVPGKVVIPKIEKGDGASVCGMRASFLGRWNKARAQTLDRQPKESKHVHR